MQGSSWYFCFGLGACSGRLDSGSFGSAHSTSSKWITSGASWGGGGGWGAGVSVGWVVVGWHSCGVCDNVRLVGNAFE